MAEGAKPAKAPKAAKPAAGARGGKAPAAEEKLKPKPEDLEEQQAPAAGEDDAEEADAREGEAAPAKSKAKAAGAPKEGAGEKKTKSKARPKPKVDADLRRALDQRKDKNAKRQEFHRQEWFRYQRLGTKWRYPQGIQSKMRRHWGTHADVVSIGHRGPKAARGLHPSGFREVLIHNADGLDGVDPAKDAVRIAAQVGRRKREALQADARKRGIRVLNWKNWED
jgi:large subunit ribosomal protein L32e